MACKNGICTPNKIQQKRPSVARVAQQQAAPNITLPPGGSYQQWNGPLGAAYPQQPSFQGGNQLMPPNLPGDNQFMPQNLPGNMMPQEKTVDGGAPAVGFPENYSMNPLNFKDPEDARKWYEFYKSNPGVTRFFPQYLPHQQQILDQLLRSGMQGLQQNPLNFQPIEDRARRNFQTETIPGLAERFTSLGTGGSQRSSAFAGRLGAAGSDLESQLAELRSKFGILGQQNALSQLQAGLSPRFQSSYSPEQPSALAGFGNAVGTGGGYAAALALKSIFGF